MVLGLKDYLKYEKARRLGVNITIICPMFYKTSYGCIINCRLVLILFVKTIELKCKVYVCFCFNVKHCHKDCFLFQADNIVDKQLGTATYMLDILALRVGNEKDSDEEADTVGCCSLRKEHISFNVMLLLLLFRSVFFLTFTLSFFLYRKKRTLLH
jgi:hypothetical protein